MDLLELVKHCEKQAIELSRLQSQDVETEMRCLRDALEASELNRDKYLKIVEFLFNTYLPENKTFLEAGKGVLSDAINSLSDSTQPDLPTSAVIAKLRNLKDAFTRVTTENADFSKAISDV